MCLPSSRRRHALGAAFHLTAPHAAEPITSGVADRRSHDIGQPLRPPASVEAIAKYTTTKLNGFAVVGDWSWLLLGMRQDLRIEASRDTYDPSSQKGFPTYSVLVRATLRMDVAVLKPQAFAILSAFTGS